MDYKITLSSLLISLVLSACGGSAGNGATTEPGTTITTTTAGTPSTTGTPTTAGTPSTTGTPNTTGTDTSTGTGTTEPDSAPEYTTPDDVVECSVDDIKRRVDWDMRDYYIYYDQVPVLNLDDYESGNDLIEALRVDPDIYSSVRETSVQSALSDNGTTSGLGFSLRWAADDVLRFREVDIGSPADRAGMRRGDALVTIDGRLPEDIPDDEWSPIFEPENSPVLMTIRTGDDAPRAVSVAHEEYRWVTAGPSALFTSTSNPSLPKVGYLSIASFLETTQDEIDAALAEIKSSGGADELIVDLRYNGGGRTRIARYLGALVGGTAVEGKVITETTWNDKYAENNSSQIFEAVSEPLNMSRVFVLTTGRTSSASEIFINSLEPFIDVVVIGGVTSGKPFTSNGKKYCGKTINAMRSVRTNSVGVSVAGGIQPDCFVDDDWQTPLNSTRDPLVNASLNFVQNGGCIGIVANTTPQTRSSIPSRRIYEPEDRSSFISEE